MLYQVLITIAMLSILILPMYVNEVYGHGLGGDQAPPIDFSGMQVTVATQLDPSDITVGEVDSANISIRFFDLITDNNLDKVTYGVEIWRGGELLSRKLFYDADGQLDIEIRPRSDCNEIQRWRCTTYNGEIEPIGGGLFARGLARPLITGPIFDKGGLYNIRVDIEGATSPKVQVAERLSFETFVSVAQNQNFFIQTAQAQELPVIVKTYYDEVENLQFDKGNNSISFEMPFDWNPEYVDLVQVVHEEVRVPKSFEPYKEGTEFIGYIDDIELSSKALLIDPFSSPDENIIHFMVSGSELKRVNQELGSSHYDSNKMFFELVPKGVTQTNSFSIDFDTGAKVDVEWNTKFGAGSEIPFGITFFDAFGNLLKDVRYGYTLTDENGKELLTNIGNDPTNPGLLASEGIDTESILIPSSGVYQLQIAIMGQGIGSSTNLKYSGIASGFFEVGPSGQKIVPPASTPASPAKERVPVWIKNNAKWWSEGQIGEADFVNGIQFLIKEKIINIPDLPEQASETAKEKVPDWIKNNAGWWANGLISEDDFVNGIKYLVENGIISV